MKTRARLSVALLATLCLFTLSGCDRLAMMERQTYAICLGVDRTEDGGILLSVQTPVNGSGDDTSATPEYSVFTGQGEDLDAAMNVLTATTPCAVSFCQLKLCILGAELASREELQPLMHKLVSLPSMRPDATVLIALNKSEDVLQALKPDFGMRMSTYLDIFLDRLERSRLLPRVTVTGCLRDLNAETRDPLLGVCAVNAALREEAKPDDGVSPNSQNAKSAETFSYGQIEKSSFSVPDSIAGSLPRTGSNPVEYLGSAAVGDGRVAGLLDAETTQTVLCLQNDGRLEAACRGERTQLRIRLSDASRQYAALSDERIQKAVEALQALHCDALGFGGAGATLFLYNRDWEEWDFKSRYPTAEILVIR